MQPDTDLVKYFDVSPDPLIAGCANTGEENTDGVVFIGIEPMDRTYCFVGRQSILEAFSLLQGITVAEVKKLLKAHNDLALERERVKELTARLKSYQDWAAKAEDAGVVLVGLED